MSIQIYVVALLFVTVLGNCGCQTEDSTPLDSGHNIYSRILLFEKQVADLLKNIIANGIKIGDFNIPSLDPIQTNISISGMDTPGIMLIEHATLINPYITGLGDFENHALGIELGPGTASIIFNLTINVVGTAEFIDLNVTIGETIPFYGDGTLTLNASIDLSGAIVANTSPYITLKGIPLYLNISSLGVHISNLMGLGETHESGIFNDLIGEVTPPTVDMLAPIMINSLVPTINTFLDDKKLTYLDLAGCLLKPSCDLFG